MDPVTYHAAADGTRIEVDLKAFVVHEEAYLISSLPLVKIGSLT